MLPAAQYRRWLTLRRIRSVIEQVAGPPSEAIYHNTTRLLVGGEEAFPAMEALIASAKRTIHVEMYMVHDDAIGRRMRDLLALKAAQGVRVRMVYDSVGSIGTPDEFFDPIREGRGDVRTYLLFNPIARGNINRRNHRKLIIADGSAAILGGINWTVDSLPPEQGGGGWIDHAVQLRGPVVPWIDLHFWRTWLLAGGPAPGSEQSLYPPQRRAGRSTVIPRSNRTFQREPVILDCVISAVEGAHSSIRIMHSYFIPNSRLLKALRDASRRGVAIEIITPGNSDVPIAQAATRYYYPRLIRSGARVYERQGPVLHAKVMTIDGKWSLLGSSNLNYRSFLLNEELCVEIRGRQFARRLDRDMDRNRAASRRVRFSDTRAWSFGMRLFHFICHLFRRWI